MKHSSPGLVGAHVIISSRKPQADRAFLRDVLDLPHVDVGEGWLTFGLPPAEVAIHPSRKNNEHECYFMVANIKRFVGEMRNRKVKSSPVKDYGWGLLTQIRLPGGGRLGVYEARHARPKSRRIQGPATLRVSSAPDPIAAVLVLETKG